MKQPNSKPENVGIDWNSLEKEWERIDQLPSFEGSLDSLKQYDSKSTKLLEKIREKEHDRILLSQEPSLFG